MKYLYLIRVSLLELLEYRANLPIRSFAFIINLSLTLFLWLAVTGSRPQIFGYSRNDLFLYYLFMSAVLPLVIGGNDLAQKVGGDIKSGDLNGILLKPVKPLHFYGAISLSERLKDFITIFPLVILVGIFAHIQIHLTTTTIFILLASLLATFILNHLFMAIVGLIAFWTTEIGWTGAFVTQIINLFSGVRFPTNFYPLAISTFISLTPIYYFGFFPTSIFLQNGPIDIPTAFVIQIIWSIILLAVLSTLWKRGLAIYEGASQ